MSGSLVPAGDTELYVVERGSGHPLFLLHGEPGDHHMFADYLDPLAERFRLLLVDLRGHGLSGETPPETCTLEQMARDISALAASLGLERYAVLGHSMGSFVALQHAVDSPGAAAQTIVSSGVPALRFLDGATDALDAFEPEDLRRQILSSIERESTAQTPGEVTALMRDQLPVHFADPRDPRIADYAERTAASVYRPRDTASPGVHRLRLDRRRAAARGDRAANARAGRRLGPDLPAAGLRGDRGGRAARRARRLPEQRSFHLRRGERAVHRRRRLLPRPTRGAPVNKDVPAENASPGEPPRGDISPRVTSETRVQHNLRVPMRDGVELSLDLVRPDIDGPLPVVLVRTPVRQGRESAPARTSTRSSRSAATSSPSRTCAAASTPTASSSRTSTSTTTATTPSSGSPPRTGATATSA